MEIVLYAGPSNDDAATVVTTMKTATVVQLVLSDDDGDCA